MAVKGKRRDEQLGQLDSQDYLEVLIGIPLFILPHYEGRGTRGEG